MAFWNWGFSLDQLELVCGVKIARIRAIDALKVGVSFILLACFGV